MKKLIMALFLAGAIGSTGYALRRVDNQQQYVQAEVAQASCTYAGQSYPEGTVIEGRVCKNGKWN